MTDIKSFLTSLKITWLRRLIQNDSKYQLIFESCIARVSALIQRGDNFLSTLIHRCTNPFWVDVLRAWMQLNRCHKDYTISDIISTNILDNNSICVGSKPIFIQDWHRKTVYFISDLLDKEGNLMNYNLFTNTFKIKVNYLTYFGIYSVIKSYIESITVFPIELNKTDIILPKRIQIILQNRKGSKAMYHRLLPKRYPIKSQEKWRAISYEKWHIFNSLPFSLCKNSKLQWFQFRINHRIIATNKLLFKMNIKDTESCSFCRNEVEDIDHLFCECPEVDSLWHALSQWVYAQNGVSLNLCKSDCILGKPKLSCFFKPINMVLLLCRHYIYTSRCREKKLSFTELKYNILQYLKLERYICLQNDEMTAFDGIWQNWSFLFDMHI